MPRLDDAWFNARFMTKTTAKGHHYTDSIDEADGILFWCPCGYGNTEYPLDGARPHAVIATFANPRTVPVPPPDAGSKSKHGGAVRWTMTGTGIADLSLSPSVDVGPVKKSCWHGFITNGEVTYLPV